MNTALLGHAEVRDTVRDDARAASREQPRAPSKPIERLEPGECILGKYEVRGVLGYGGFAVVYDAEHIGLCRGVAIKVLHVSPETPLALVERFRREARLLALVRHRHVLEAYDTGTLADGSPYLVMERIEGLNLAGLLARGPLSLAAAIEIARQLLLGLSAVDEAGIVHRDIKPDNVMLHDLGGGALVAKLVDFGIAKRVAIEPEPRLTCHGALIGTPQYMSPEQIRGEEVDIRSDIYAIGAVLYEMLSGRAPHESNNFSELVVAVLNGRIEPLSQRRSNCPVELDRVMAKALARARGRRYGSPQQFLAALDEVAESLALPRGAEAFQTCHEPAVVFESTRRSCAGSLVRRLSALQRARPRTMQLAALLLTLALPGSALFILDVSNGESASAPPRAGPPTLAAHAAPLPVGRPIVTRPVEPQPGKPEAAPLNVPPEPIVASEGGESAATASTPGRADGEPTQRGRARTEGATHAESAARTESDAAGEPRAVRETGAGSEAHAGQQPARDEGRVARADELPVKDRVAAATEQAEAELERALGPARASRDAVTPGRLLPAPTASAGNVDREQWQVAMQDALSALVRGQLEAAKQHYLRAVTLDPKEPTGFRGLGLVAARLGDSRGAREALERYLALAPGARDADAITTRITALSR